MLEIFVTFFKLGLFTIGGGVAMIPVSYTHLLRTLSYRYCRYQETVRLPQLIQVGMLSCGYLT